MLKKFEVTEKSAVIRIVWKIPRKSRLETRIKSIKNKSEGRNEFPGVEGIDTVLQINRRYHRYSRNEFPKVKSSYSAPAPLIIIMFTEKAVYTCCLVAFSPY